jgi:hypothetical protein
MRLFVDLWPFGDLQARVRRMPPGPDRWRERSWFFTGIAEAMADQWGNDATKQFDREAA